MRPQLGAFSNIKTPCILCGEQTVREFPDVENFQYGCDEDAVMLQAPVFVHHCTSCDQAWTDWRAEDSRTTAVEEHLKTKGVYLCAICHETPIDVRSGYDTCDRCSSSGR